MAPGVCVDLVFYSRVYVAPVITDYRHLASDPRPGNESIHGEVVHNSIDSLLPNVQRNIDTPGKKHSKKKTKHDVPVQIPAFDGMETVSVPFPPRQCQ